METPEMHQFNVKLRDRTMNLTVNIRNILVSMVIKPIDKPVIKQLIRSSSSVAANYSAATRGRSDAEFYSKICIVVEEPDETLFWMDYLVRIEIISANGAQNLRNETEELVRLFSSIKRKMKEKLDKRSKVGNEG